MRSKRASSRNQLAFSFEAPRADPLEGIDLVERVATRMRDRVPLKPDCRLVTFTDSGGSTLGRALLRRERVYKEERPDGVDIEFAALEALHADGRWQRVVHPRAPGDGLERMTFRRRCA